MLDKKALGIGILALSLCIATPALARDFSGHWVGTGQMTGTLGGACSKIDITIQQSQGQFTIQSYDASCGFMDSNWGPVSMTINGSQVLDDDGDPIGTFSPTVLDVNETEVTETYIFHFVLQTSADGKRTLQATYGTGNGQGSLSITGDLQEQ